VLIRQILRQLLNFGSNGANLLICGLKIIHDFVEGIRLLPRLIQIVSKLSGHEAQIAADNFGRFEI
jgi:hypothetical protein